MSETTVKPGRRAKKLTIDRRVELAAIASNILRCGYSRTDALGVLIAVFELSPRAARDLTEQAAVLFSSDLTRSAVDGSALPALGINAVRELRDLVKQARESKAVTP